MATWGCVQASQQSGGACWPQGTTSTVEADPAGSSLHRQYQDVRRGCLDVDLPVAQQDPLSQLKTPAARHRTPNRPPFPTARQHPCSNSWGRPLPGPVLSHVGPLFTFLHAVLLARCPLGCRPCHHRFSALSSPRTRPPFPAKQSRCLCGAYFFPGSSYTCRFCFTSQCSGRALQRRGEENRTRPCVSPSVSGGTLFTSPQPVWY